MTLFLGKPVEYWQEVQSRIDNLGVEHLLDQLAEVNAKVRYYERMLDDAAQYREAVDRRFR